MTLEPGHRPDPTKVAQHPASRLASSPTGRAARAALLYALAATALIVGADRLAVADKVLGIFMRGDGVVLRAEPVVEAMIAGLRLLGGMCLPLILLRMSRSR